MLTIHVWPRRLKEFLLTHPLYKSPGLRPITKTDTARSTSSTKRRDHRAVQWAIGLTGAYSRVSHGPFAHRRPLVASFHPAGIPAVSDTKSSASQKVSKAHFRTILFFRVSSCRRRPFVFDDTTKPEGVNTAKRQRAKRARAKFQPRWHFGVFNRAPRDLPRHRLS